MVSLGQARLLGRKGTGALVDGLWNRAAGRMIGQWIAAEDTPGTVYHLHGWSQILSPAVFAALEPVRGRLVISAHDFFLACANGAFANFSTGAACPHIALSRACLGEPCDRRGTAHKLWRTARHAVQQRAYQPQSSPPVLAIHAAMRPMLARAGIPQSAIHAVPNPVTPFAAWRIRAENNREVLFVGRIEATKGADLALAAARRAGVPIRLVAMEAALAGLPVILPPTALLAPDLVSAGAGLAVDPRDTAAFAAALAALGADDGRIAAMSHAAFTQTAHLALSHEAWIDCLLGHYLARLTGDQVHAEGAGSSATLRIASNASGIGVMDGAGTTPAHMRRSSVSIG
jgi:glycosyltransferase involved in cell wall biosynthesis